MFIKIILVLTLLLIPQASKPITINEKPFYGIRAVKVEIDIDEMPEAKPMYSLEEIRTSIELSLRKSGIKVANTDAIPVLFFRVHSLKVPNDASYIHNISMYLRQDTFFARANRAGRTALVSASGRLDVSSYVGASGFHRIRETLNEAAQQLTDAFLNEWYKDNQ